MWLSCSPSARLRSIRVVCPAWYWAYANSGYKGPVPSQHEMPWRHGQEVVFVSWLFGVPALAGGLAFDAIPFVRAGAWCLFAGALLDAVNVARILRHAFVPPQAARRSIVTTP